MELGHPPFGNLARDNQKLGVYVCEIKGVSENPGKICSGPKCHFPSKVRDKKNPTNPDLITANISIIKHGHKTQQLINVIQFLLPMYRDGYCPKNLELLNVNGNGFDTSKCSMGQGDSLLSCCVSHVHNPVPTAMLYDKEGCYQKMTGQEEC